MQLDVVRHAIDWVQKESENRIVAYFGDLAASKLTIVFGDEILHIFLQI